MFFTLSYTAHTLLSISLHVTGVLAGLFIWYLFPQHPTRSIVKIPKEKVALLLETSESNDKIYTQQPSPMQFHTQKLIEVPVRHHG
ncbi:unnamed protein product [Caenorhabditis auriculariae]|uniref:Uncharacterized protein n=1 Tax=Caenorhabditis auriculariae TaxID=2777116 RepID=A0A8S1HPQ4_9PELO|nr:unnamed protein product [Caenorhabditis auriculariae]